MLILLSHKLSSSTPSYDDGPRLSLAPHKQIEWGDSSNSYLVTLPNHIGTHIDAPRHFDPAGKAVADFDISRFVFSRPLILDLPKPPEGLIIEDDLAQLTKKNMDVDLLLIRTGFQRFRETDPEVFMKRGPCLSGGAAKHIIENLPRLRCLGVDMISVSSPASRAEGREAHRHLLVGRDFFIVEDMDLLDKPLHLKRVWVVPLLIEGVDSSPCTVFAEV